MIDSDLARIRLIALDLDRTLLRSDGTPSQRSRFWVRKAVRAGIRVTIATGRPSTDAARAGAWLGAQGPIIACNGAHVLSEQKEEWLFKPIPAELTIPIIQAVKEAGLPFYIHLRGRRAVPAEYRQVFGGFPDLDAKELLRVMGIAPPVLRFSFEVLQEDRIPDRAGEIARVCVKGPVDTLKGLSSFLKGAFSQRLQCLITDGTHMDVMDGSVSKGDALRFLCEKTGIPVWEMAAVGDEDNDIEMLQVAGVGVAMANASPRLSIVADRFTLTSDQEGVSCFLKEVLAAKGA